MSFDLMVFDPDVVPRDKKPFNAWFDQDSADMSQTGGYDSNRAERDEFHRFYEQMREVFTPFNGPDNVPLPDDASQIRILRTCGYTFQPHSLYMSFRWPAQDFARAACSTFSKELGLGFYHMSSPYPQVRFPDGRFLYPKGHWKDRDEQAEKL